jgi:hypothetical protein
MVTRTPRHKKKNATDAVKRPWRHSATQFEDVAGGGGLKNPPPNSKAL